MNLRAEVVKGVEERTINFDTKRVLVLQPRDSEDDGGMFNDGAQEALVEGIGPDFLDVLAENPELAVERGVVDCSFPGMIGVGADYTIHFTQERDKRTQAAITNISNVIHEFGPLVVVDELDADKARAESVRELFGNPDSTDD